MLAFAIEAWSMFSANLSNAQIAERQFVSVHT
jgi:DNA-binding CsgD family transcriptional regulator